MPQKYPYCIDCGKPKTTPGQQRSQRCNACSGKQKRGASDDMYYTHCVDCGELRPLEKRRYPRCRQCAYDHLRKNEYFDVCQECGVSKSRTKSRLCRSCSNKQRRPYKIRAASHRKRKQSVVYPYCLECGMEKAPSKSKLCHSCSTRKAWDTQRQRILTWYDTCQKCGKDKPRTDRKLCLSCAGIKRMTEMYPDTEREYPYGWSDNYKESIRERDSRRCVLCGMTEKENGRKLDVHHIDYDKSNIAPENLLSLDMYCHPKTNWNRSFWIQVFTKYHHRQPIQDWQHRAVIM